MYMQDTVLPCVIVLTSLLPPRTQEISPSPINRLSLSVFIPLQFLLFRRHRLSRFYPHDVSQPQSLDARGPRKKKEKRKTGSGLALTCVYLESSFGSAFGKGANCNQEVQVQSVGKTTVPSGLEIQKTKGEWSAFVLFTSLSSIRQLALGTFCWYMRIIQANIGTHSHTRTRLLSTRNGRPLTNTFFPHLRHNSTCAENTVNASRRGSGVQLSQLYLV